MDLLEPGVAEAPLGADHFTDLYRYMWSPAVLGCLNAFVQLGLFEQLAQSEDGASIKALATRAGKGKQYLSAAADVLRATGFLDEREGKLRLTPASRRFLHSRGEFALARYLRHCTKLMKNYARLDELIESGAPPPLEDRVRGYFGLHENEGGDDKVREFGEPMYAATSFISQHLLQELDFPIDGRVLDVGAGFGGFSDELLKSGFSGELDLIDTPSVIRCTQRHRNRAEGRVRYIGEDLRGWHPDRDYNVLVLSHVLHEFSEAEARELLDKLLRATRERARVLFIGLPQGGAESGVSALVPAQFGLNLALELGTDNTRIEWLLDILGSHRFRRLKEVKLPGFRTAIWAGRG